MRRFVRWFFNGLTALSLLLCVANVVLWVYHRASTSPSIRYETVKLMDIVAGDDPPNLLNGRNVIVVATAAYNTNGDPRLRLASHYNGDWPWPDARPLYAIFPPQMNARPCLMCSVEVHGKLKAVTDSDGVCFEIDVAKIYGGGIPYPPDDQHPANLANAIFFLFAAVLLLIFSRRGLKLDSRPNLLGYCPTCSYDLTGNVSGTCPECGTPVHFGQKSGTGPIVYWTRPVIPAVPLSLPGTMSPVRRLLRWFWNGLTSLSLLLCVATVVMWVRSYHLTENWSWQRPASRDHELFSMNGALYLSSIENWGGPHHIEYRPAPAPSAFGHNDWSKWGDECSGILSLSSGNFPSFLRGSVRSDGISPCSLLVIPYWLLLTVGLVLPGRWVRRFVIHRHRYTRDLCPSYGYDLRASPDRCPECGTPTSSTTLST